MKPSPFIKNPLTLISIFASLTEVFGTSILPFIDKETQVIFIWFIICFPSLLVALFFITLNFNHKVLYSPSDFGEADRGIAELFYNQSQKITNSIEIMHEETTPSIDLKNRFLNFYKQKSSTFSNEDRPFFDFIADLNRKLISQLPEEKLEELWSDLVNARVFFIVSTIKKDYLKKDEFPKNNFILMLKNKNEYSNDKTVVINGLIAGSGIGDKTSGELADYIISSIKLKLK